MAFAFGRDIVFLVICSQESQAALLLTSHFSSKGAAEAVTLCVVITVQVLACLLLLSSPCVPGESLLLSGITP